MRLPTVLNDLSLRRGGSDRHAARAAMKGWVEIHAIAQEMAFERVVIVSETTPSIELCKGYTMWQWLTDPVVPQDLRQTVAVIVSARPVRERLSDINRIRFDEMLPDFDGDLAQALAAAALEEGLALSSPTQPKWDASVLKIQVERENTSHTMQVRNAAREAHLQEHKSWRASRFATLCDSGTTVWTNRAVWFPKLDFCKECAADLGAFGAPDAALRTIVNRLFAFNDQASLWKAGAFEATGLPGRPRPESEATLDQFGAERQRTLPNGSTFQFSSHVSGAEGTRIYFEPRTIGRLTIGPIIRHARTKKYR
jgi:hypothetical protein